MTSFALLLFFAITSLSCIHAKTTTRHNATMTTNTLVNVVCNDNADLSRSTTCDLFVENAVCQLHFNSTDKAQLRATCESLGCSASVCRDGLEAEDSRIGSLSTVAKVFFGLGLALFYTVDYLIGYILMIAGRTTVFDHVAPRVSVRALQEDARHVYHIDNDLLKRAGWYVSFVRLLKMRAAELGMSFQLLFVAARQVENVCLIVGIAMTVAGIPIVINSESRERVSPPLVAFAVVSWVCHVALWTVCVALYVQYKRRTRALCSMFVEFADRLEHSSVDGLRFCVARTDIAPITECEFDHVAKLFSKSIAVVCVVTSPAVSDDAIHRALMTTRPSAVGFANDHPEFVDF
jgi:hypothetical protein